MYSFVKSASMYTVKKQKKVASCGAFDCLRAPQNVAAAISRSAQHACLPCYQVQGSQHLDCAPWTLLQQRTAYGQVCDLCLMHAGQQS